MQREYPLNGILVYSGSVASIPATFRLCDGTHGTPDLRNKFIVGAGDSYAVGAIGGNTIHGHAFTSNLHTHEITGGASLDSNGTAEDLMDSKSVNGTTNDGSTLAPYFAKAFIMYAGKAL